MASRIHGKHPRTAPPPVSSRAPTAPRGRADSYVRMRGPEQTAEIPPLPFELEGSVETLSWWLDDHMAFAANLACTERFVHAFPDAPSARPAMAYARHLLDDLYELRDALFEVYRDASDPRTAPLFVNDAAAVEADVKGFYRIARRVADAVWELVAGIRSTTPTWTAARAELSGISAELPAGVGASRERMQTATSVTAFDDASVHQPRLRVRRNAERLFEVVDRLAARLQLVRT